MKRFFFLATDYDEYYRLCTDAENLAEKKPLASLNTSRSSIELLVRSLVGETERLIDGIRRMQQLKICNYQIIDLLHKVRKLGNRGSHGDSTATSRDAEKALDYLAHIFIWYVLDNRKKEYPLDRFDSRDHLIVRQYRPELFVKPPDPHQEEIKKQLTEYQRKLEQSEFEKKEITRRAQELEQKESMLEVEKLNQEAKTRKIQEKENALRQKERQLEAERKIIDALNQDVTFDYGDQDTDNVFDSSIDANQSFDKTLPSDTVDSASVCFDIQKLPPADTVVMSAVITASDESSDSTSSSDKNSVDSVQEFIDDFKELIAIPPETRRKICIIGAIAIIVASIFGPTIYRKVSDVAGVYFYNEAKTSDKFEQFSKAFNYYRISANCGNKDAMYELAKSYEYGYGTYKDAALAYEWYLKAADAGCPAAYNNLAQIHLAKEEFEKCIELLTKGAKLGDSQCQYELADVYFYGKHVQKNYVLALALYIDSANQNNKYAQYKLGLCYKDAKGVAYSYDKAKLWLTKASENGIGLAKAHLAELDEKQLQLRKTGENVSTINNKK